MISGFSTPDGTKEFTQKNTNALPINYKQSQNLTLSNVGVGTYLGNPDEITILDFAKEIIKNAYIPIIGSHPKKLVMVNSIEA